MKTDVIESLTNSFEEKTQRTDTGVEHWFRRSLQSNRAFDALKTKLYKSEKPR